MTSDTPATRLYLVTPKIVDAAAFRPLLEAALEAADAASVLVDVAADDPRQAKTIVQALAPVVQGRGAALLIRDAERAARWGADGVHLAASEDAETGLREALDSLQPERIVGVGALRSRHAAMRAGEMGADYVMFGDPPLAGAAIDPDLVRERVAWWGEIFTIPCVAYAAHLYEVAPLAAAGADFIAVCAALWSDPRGPATAAREAACALARAIGAP